MLMFVANKSACMVSESLNVVVCTTSAPLPNFSSKPLYASKKKNS